MYYSLMIIAKFSNHATSITLRFSHCKQISCTLAVARFTKVNFIFCHSLINNCSVFQPPIFTFQGSPVFGVCAVRSGGACCLLTSIIIRLVKWIVKRFLRSFFTLQDCTTPRPSFGKILCNFHKTAFPRHSSHQIPFHFGITNPTHFLSPSLSNSSTSPIYPLFLTPAFSCFSKKFLI